MPGPLDGIRVVEVAQEIQGPYASMHLADLGANVIKVETPKIGDLSRHMLIKLIAGEGAKNAEFSHYFLAMNRGKRSITLDLKHPGGKEVLWRLIDRADVLVTNYRPGVFDRLGFGWEALHARQSAPRVRARLVVGAARPVEDAPEPRHARAGRGRPDGEDGARGRRAPRRGRARRRSLRRDHAVVRDSRRAVLARAHGQRPACRRLDLRHRARAPADGAELHVALRCRDSTRRSRTPVPARRVGRLRDQGRARSAWPASTTSAGPTSAACWASSICATTRPTATSCGTITAGRRRTYWTRSSRPARRRSGWISSLKSTCSRRRSRVIRRSFAASRPSRTAISPRWSTPTSAKFGSWALHSGFRRRPPQFRRPRRSSDSTPRKFSSTRASPGRRSRACAATAQLEAQVFAENVRSEAV